MSQTTREEEKGRGKEGKGGTEKGEKEAERAGEGASCS